MKSKWMIRFAICVGFVSAVLGFVMYLKNPIDPAEFDAPIWSSEDPNHKVTMLHKNGKQVSYKLSELTQLHATEGWNDCLCAFWMDREWLAGKAWKHIDTGEPFSEPWLLDAPDEVNSIRHKGWKACSERLNKLCDLFSEKKVRKAVGKRLSAPLVQRH